MNQNEKAKTNKHQSNNQLLADCWLSTSESIVFKSLVYYGSNQAACSNSECPSTKVWWRSVTVSIFQSNDLLLKVLFEDDLKWANERRKRRKHLGVYGRKNNRKYELKSSHCIIKFEYAANNTYYWCMVILTWSYSLSIWPHFCLINPVDKTS
jgi:hypothetical protein